MLRLDRLRWPEWAIGAGGAILLLSLLALPWYRGRAGSLTGWSGLTHLRWVLVVVAAVALAGALAQASRRAPAIPLALTVFATLLGGVATVLLVYRVLADPPGGSRKVGGFLALAGALAIAYGGWRSLRKDGIAVRDAPADIPVVDPFGQARS